MHCQCVLFDTFGACRPEPAARRDFIVLRQKRSTAGILEHISGCDTSRTDRTLH